MIDLSNINLHPLKRQDSYTMRRRRVILFSYLLYLPAIVRCVPKNFTRQYLLSTLENDGLLWQDLAVYSQEDGSVILPSFTGHVQNGHLCGILGPSGAGKSSFLLTLAGLQTLPQRGQVWAYVMSQDSDLELHHVPPHHVAWLQQEDVFFNMLTVRETLELTAFLELPFSTQHEREQLVQSQLLSLGLAHAADRQVGDFYGSGSRLSGGERRRLSLALELLTEKQLFVADEPTSGLDSSMSVKVIKLIKELAVERNIPCFCALHQPRSSIWHALDDLILMGPRGRVCYSGPKEDAIEYFKDIGYPCPAATNPAEFFVDLVSVDTEDPAEAAKDEKRVDDLAAAFREYQQEWSKYKRRHSKDVNVSVSGGLLFVKPKFSPFRWMPRLGALVRRSWRQNIRIQSVNIFRFCASAVNAVLLAQIFPTVRGPVPTANSVADRVALLSFGAINMCFIAFMKTITLISGEKPVVQREQTRLHYSALEYILAKVFAELPLDSLFAAVFTTVLKQYSGVRISWKKLTSVFSLLTTAGASLGLMIGSWVPSGELSTTASIPVLVILMVVGISEYSFRLNEIRKRNFPTHGAPFFHLQLIPVV